MGVLCFASICKHSGGVRISFVIGYVEADYVACGKVWRTQGTVQWSFRQDSENASLTNATEPLSASVLCGASSNSQRGLHGNQVSRCAVKCDMYPQTYVGAMFCSNG